MQGISGLQQCKRKYLRYSEKCEVYDCSAKASDLRPIWISQRNDWKEFVKSQRRNSNGDFIFAAAVDTRFSIQDSFYLDKNYMMNMHLISIVR